MNESLDAYREPFKAAVCEHIRQTLLSSTWEWFRDLAKDRSRFVDPNDTSELDVSPEVLVDIALSEDSISVQETLVPGFKEKAVEIERIDGQPLYYVEGQGIYVWGKQPDSSPTLMLWLTHPAYPPAW